MIFRVIGKPNLPPKPCGSPPGWPKGKEMKRQNHYEVVRKGLKQPIPVVSAA
jgi:hypothetical protein